jgi:hypothetical protein
MNANKGAQLYHTYYIGIEVCLGPYLTIKWGIYVCLCVCPCVGVCVCLSGYTFLQFSTDLLHIWMGTFYGS